jgi:hypothetical protein
MIRRTYRLNLRAHRTKGLWDVFGFSRFTIADVHGGQQRVRERNTDSNGVVVSRSPRLPLITGKFARQSHAAACPSQNAVFHRLWGAARVGSIPIARSTSRLASGPVGTRDWCQHVDPVGKRWERTSIWRRSRVLTYPQVAPPFTRTVTRGDFKNSLCDSHTIRQRSRLAGIDP